MAFSKPSGGDSSSRSMQRAASRQENSTQQRLSRRAIEEGASHCRRLLTDRWRSAYPARVAWHQPMSAHRRLFPPVLPRPDAPEGFRKAEALKTDDCCGTSPRDRIPGHSGRSLPPGAREGHRHECLAIATATRSTARRLRAHAVLRYRLLGQGQLLVLRGGGASPRGRDDASHVLAWWRLSTLPTRGSPG